MSFADKFDKLRKRFEAYKDHATHALPKMGRTFTVSSAAAVGGLVEGKFGERATWKKIPLVAAAGLFLNVADYFGLGGEHGAQLGNIGDGLLASVAQSFGFHFGQKWAAGHLGAGAAPAALPAGAGAAKVTGEVSPQMVAQIADQVRQSLNATR